MIEAYGPVFQYRGAIHMLKYFVPFVLSPRIFRTPCAGMLNMQGYPAQHNSDSLSWCKDSLKMLTGIDPTQARKSRLCSPIVESFLQLDYKRTNMGRIQGFGYACTIQPRLRLSSL